MKCIICKENEVPKGIEICQSCIKEAIKNNIQNTAKKEVKS